MEDDWQPSDSWVSMRASPKQPILSTRKPQCPRSREVVVAGFLEKFRLDHAIVLALFGQGIGGVLNE